MGKVKKENVIDIEGYENFDSVTMTSEEKSEKEDVEEMSEGKKTDKKKLGLILVVAGAVTAIGVGVYNWFVKKDDIDDDSDFDAAGLLDDEDDYFEDAEIAAEYEEETEVDNEETTE